MGLIVGLIVCLGIWLLVEAHDSPTSAYCGVILIGIGVIAGVALEFAP